MQGQDSAPAQAIATVDAVPATHHLRGKPEIFGDGFDGVPFADSISSNPAGGGGVVAERMLAGGNRDEDFRASVEGGYFEVVRVRNRLRGQVILARERSQRVAGQNLVVAPPQAHILRYLGDGGLILVLCPDG